MILKADLAKEPFSETKGIRWETFILISDLSNTNRECPELEDRTTAAGEKLIFDCKIFRMWMTERSGINRHYCVKKNTRKNKALDCRMVALTFGFPDTGIY